MQLLAVLNLHDHALAEGPRDRGTDEARLVYVVDQCGHRFLDDVVSLSAYVERPARQGLFSDGSSRRKGAVICPAFQRGLHRWPR